MHSMVLQALAALLLLLSLSLLPGPLAAPRLYATTPAASAVICCRSCCQQKALHSALEPTLSPMAGSSCWALLLFLLLLLLLFMHSHCRTQSDLDAVQFSKPLQNDLQHEQSSSRAVDIKQ
jgi:hypothetical protein